jgi:ribosomal protein S6E (S10)
VAGSGAVVLADTGCVDGAEVEGWTVGDSLVIITSGSDEEGVLMLEDVSDTTALSGAPGWS